MTPDTAARLQALYDKFKAFPEGAKLPDGSIPLRREAFTAFLDARQLIEREVLPYVSGEVRRAREADDNRQAQAIVDNLNRNVRAKDEVFAQLRSAEERNVHLALERMRKQHKSLEGADGLLAFFSMMLDVMGGDAGK